MATMDTIQKLATRQQQLWSMAGQHKLKAAQQDELKKIRSELETLWHTRRCELAAEQKQRLFVDDLLDKEWMCDYKDRLSLRYSAGSDLRIESEWVDTYTGYTPPPSRQRQRVTRRPVVTKRDTQTARLVATGVL